MRLFFFLLAIVGSLLFILSFMPQVGHAHTAMSARGQSGMVTGIAGLLWLRSREKRR